MPDHLVREMEEVGAKHVDRLIRSFFVRLSTVSSHARWLSGYFDTSQLGCCQEIRTGGCEVDKSIESLSPEHEDLSQLLSEIPEELADQQAEGFLLAGERLLLQQMGLDGAVKARAPFKEVLAGISRRRVVSEAQRDEARSSLTEGGLRHRWKTMSAYLSDLIHFALRSLLLKVQHPAQMHELRSAVAEIPTVKMVEQIAFEEVAATYQNPAFRLQVAFQALFPDDEVVVRALRQVDRRQVDGWRDLYSGILEDRGLRLRPGTTVEDLTLALHLAGKAVSFRAVLPDGQGRDRYAKAIDHENRTTFLSQLALAILVGFIDPGDGRTLHQAASAVLGDEAQAENKMPTSPRTGET